LGCPAIKRKLRLIFNEKLQTLTISGAATFCVQRDAYLKLPNIIANSHTCSLDMSRNMSEIV